MKYSKNVATALRSFTKILQKGKINKMETFRKLQDVADLLTDNYFKIIENYCYGDDEEMSPTESHREKLNELYEIERKYNAILELVISDCQPRG